jgi:hypothetical protein
MGMMSGQDDGRQDDERKRTCRPPELVLSTGGELSIAVVVL